MKGATVDKGFQAEEVAKSNQKEGVFVPEITCCNSPQTFIGKDMLRTNGRLSSRSQLNLH